MIVAEEVDRLLPGPALVFGSLPPGGRDLDLLLRPGDLAGARERLAAAGWTIRGETAARFHDGRADVVDLVPSDDWRLPADELERLFGEALPLEGFERLARPAPHHALLILARRVERNPGAFDEKRRLRIDAALAEDPGAWERSAGRAEAWSAKGALDRLRSLHAGEEPKRARRLPRPRRGALVTLSGLDGSGKSSQAEVLQGTLEALGYDTEVVWTSLVAHPALGAVGEPVKRLLRRLRRGGEPAPASEWAQPASEGSSDPARALRQRSGALTQVWATYVALVNAWWQSRATRPLLIRGKVVICDRWTLDSKVQMRYQYGSERRFGFQARLVRLLSPRPAASFLLDISPEEAMRRKPEYTLEQNDLRARLYREDHAALGVTRVDGELKRGDVAAQIADEVWRKLAG